MAGSTIGSACHPDETALVLFRRVNYPKFVLNTAQSQDEIELGSFVEVQSDEVSESVLRAIFQWFNHFADGIVIHISAGPAFPYILFLCQIFC